jgi:hypothetical protein
MSASFVAQLRTRRPPIGLTEPGAPVLTLRVAVADLWETVRVTANPETPVSVLKQRVVSEFFPDTPYPEDYVLKLRGWEVLDESGSLQECGVVDGSILLLAYRRRRAVR